MDSVTIEVKSERATYRVVIGAGLAAQPDAWLPADAAGIRVVVTCPPVWRALSKSVETIADGGPAVMMPDGERAKTLATVAKLYDAFSRRRLDRSGTVVAIGGGVVGDVAGFAAAT